MQHSYLLSGISFGRFVQLLARNGFSFRYIKRILFLLQGSLWASLFKRIERLRLSTDKLPGQEEIVFIVGHWRTGSTFLHQLLSLDERFVTPTVVQVAVPESFCVSANYFSRVMRHVMGNKRPMDNVRLSPDEPQEDEYALLKMMPDTPLEALIFPDKNRSFCESLMERMNAEVLSCEWKKKFTLFGQRLVYSSGKQKATLLYKNPFHSCRIPQLKQLYPKARFIHIHRHPLEVLPSTAHMWNVVGQQNRLKGTWKTVSPVEMLPLFNHVHQAIKSAFAVMPETDYVEVSYADLEADPKQMLKSVYSHFSWELSDAYASGLAPFLDDLKDYKKNDYHLQDEERNCIIAGASDYLNQYPSNPYKNQLHHEV